MLGVPRAVCLHVWREEVNRLRRKRGTAVPFAVHWAYIQHIRFLIAMPFKFHSTLWSTYISQFGKCVG